MSLKKRIDSLRFARQGLATLFRTQPNARIHLLATAGVIAAGCFFQVSATEWLLVVFCIVLVISMEAMNTAIEFLTDLASPEYHPLAGKAKDVAAAAVLLATVGAIVVGTVIFGKKIMDWAGM